MEIKYVNKEVYVDGVELKKTEINTEKMIEFIDKIIVESNAGEIKKIGDIKDPFQELIERIIEGAENPEFKNEINKLEEDKKKLEKKGNEFENLDFEYKPEE